jgi:GNAT superfamily N-acetyltransferase
MTSLPDLAVEVDQANFRLGNHVSEEAGALFVQNTAIPDIYDANHVASVRARTADEIDELLATVDQRYAYCQHRRFLVDHRTPPEFVARLQLDGGYEYSSSICMVLEGELVGEAPPCDIRPLESEADWEACLQMTRADFRESRERRNEPDPGDHVALHLYQSKRWRQPPVQYWIAFVDGEPAGHFHSWVGLQGLGQVEDLYVTPSFRKQGVATALIHHCVRQLRDAGIGPVLIVSDPTDTPKNLYARMGFRPVAVAGAYHRKLEQLP